MRSSPEIEAIVRRIWSARVRGDLELLEGLWTESDCLLIVGSDEDEWIEGARESVAVTSAQIREWPIQESELLRIRAFEDGNVGWAAYEEKRTNPNGRSSIFRRTVVFLLEAGSWKIVQSHFSTTVPNLEAAGVELTRSLSDLLDSIGSESELLLLTDQMSVTSTFLFTDIVDSTGLSQRMGEIAWSRAIRNHFTILRTVAEEHGGSMVKTLGDGGMYVFSSGSSALEAAIEIQQSVTAASLDSPFQVRIGIHTGDVVHTEGDYVGLTVNKAARVAPAARGGQILVSSTTVGMVGSSLFEFESPVLVELKGLAGTHQLYPLNWEQRLS